MSFRTQIIQKVIDINERLIFYPKLKRFYQTLLTNETIQILDVGTNKGQSIDFFLSINPKAEIVGFEPNKKLYQKLIKKYKKKSNIKIFNLGVSSSEGNLIFHENVLDETSTFEELNKDSEYLKRKAKILGVSTENIIKDSYEVKVIALNAFLKQQKIKAVDLLKIDVEGHEYDCLKGLFTNNSTPCPVRYLQLESHHDDMYTNDNRAKIADILKENNFVEIERVRHGFGDFYELIFENTLLR